MGTDKKITGIKVYKVVKERDDGAYGSAVVSNRAPNYVRYWFGEWSTSLFPVFAFRNLNDAIRFAERETNDYVYRKRVILLCYASDALDTSFVMNSYLLGDPDTLSSYWDLTQEEKMEWFNGNRWRRNVQFIVDAPPGTVQCSSVMPVEVVETVISGKLQEVEEND